MAQEGNDEKHTEAEDYACQWISIFDEANDDGENCNIIATYGGRLSISDNVLTTNPSTSGYTADNTLCFAFGKSLDGDDKGECNYNYNDIIIVEWKFKILKRSEYIWIGIAENDTDNVDKIDYESLKNMKGCYYMFKYNGNMYTHKNQESHVSKSNIRLNTNRLVTMQLNLQKKSLSFWDERHPQSRKTVFDEIDMSNNKKYKLAIGMSGDNTNQINFRKCSIFYNINKNTFTIASQTPQLSDVIELLLNAIKNVDKQYNKLKEHGENINSNNTDNGDNKELIKIQDLLNISSNVEFCKLRIKKINKLLIQLSEMVNKLEKENDKYLKPDINKYKEWSVNEMVLWIMSLENGRFSKYCDTLKENLIRNEISGDELPQITRQDLDTSFGINKFGDRTALEKYLKQLGQ